MANKANKPKPMKTEKHPDEKRESFAIIGIGASAGGLEALQQLFRAMPDDTGMGIVVVTHQHPGHESLLPDLLSRETRMPVVQIGEGMHVEANHVYVLGSGVVVHIEGGNLHLSDLDTSAQRWLPIDIFFRSLAHDMHERAVGVVMSGTGSDGTSGIREIKDQGGMTLAQKTASARFGGMTESAQKTGLVDFVATPAEIPQKIMEYITAPYVIAPQKARDEGMSSENIEAILRFLRSRRGQDFSSYKRSTIERRLQRRMSVHGIAKAPDYLSFLQENSQEAQLLFQELLISVTSFFRDPDAFAALEKKHLPPIIKDWPEDRELRVWVAGCATGEEAYSIAIVLDEVRRRFNKSFDIRVFGTDLDAQAIEQARRGTYPASIAVDVSQQRLHRYFVGEDSHSYTIRKEIRDMVIFAQQNMLSDPPFARLQLVVCRNVLIYLQNNLQQRLLPLFHHALTPDGLLFLGSSESVGAESRLFETLDARWRIFRRTNVAAELPKMPIAMQRARHPRQDQPRTPPSGASRTTDRLVERMLLDQYVPVSIVFDHEGAISYIHGRTGAYLEPGQRQPRLNVFDMAREGLEMPLRSAARQALKDKERVVKKGIRVRTNGEYETVELAVSRIVVPEALRGMLLAVITPATPGARPPAEEKKGARQGYPDRRGDLERELLYCKEANQNLRKEMQTNQEEMQSSNEELQSINEELQSPKEEMESLNEELATVNNELSGKNQELTRARDDLQNLLNSTDLAVIFLDQQLHVKGYTARARTFVGLRDTDIDRPISDLQIMMEGAGLVEECRHVLDTLEKREKEVITPDGRPHLMRVLPYRSAENVIDGVVVTFIEITDLKQAIEALRQSEERYRALVTATSQSVYRMSPDWKEMRELLGGGFLADTKEPDSQWTNRYIPAGDREHFWSVINESIRTRTMFQLEHRVVRADGAVGWSLSRAAPLLDDNGEIYEWFGAASDITDREDARRYAENIIDTIREALVVLDGDLKVVSANRTFYRQFNVNAEETQGRFLYDLGNRQWDIPRLRELLEKIIPEKNIMEDYEVQHTFQDIGEKIMVLNARRLRVEHEASEPLVLMAIEDQTEKRTALRRLDKSETRYRRLVEEIHSFIIGIDTDGNISFFNAFSEKTFGYSREEVIGKPYVGTVVPPVDSYGTNNAGIIEQILAEPGKFGEVRSEGVCKDGRKIFFAWSAIPVPGQGGEGIEILIDGNDITAAKRAEEALKSNYGLLRQAFDVETVGILFFDMKSNFTDANEAFLRMIGYDRQSLERGELRSERVTAPEWMPRTGQMFEKLKATGRFRPYEKELIRPDGTRWWGLFAGARLGENLAVAFVIDITGQKKTEQALQRRSEDLAAANRELETFTYSVSHDLSAPLRTVSGFAEILEEDYIARLDEQGQEYLRHIEAGARKMQRRIDGLLSLSRIGRQEIHREEVDLSAIVRDHLEEIHAADPEREVEEVVPNDVRDQADPRLISLALENLIRNAWKFTAKEERPRIEFGLFDREGQTVYFIRDNGAGFDGTYAAKVFTPFQRLHGENEFAGTGIGLSIVQRVIARHGGQVWAEGAAGKGATFYFTLDGKK